MTTATITARRRGTGENPATIFNIPKVPADPVIVDENLNADMSDVRPAAPKGQLPDTVFQRFNKAKETPKFTGPKYSVKKPLQESFKFEKKPIPENEQNDKKVIEPFETQSLTNVSGYKSVVSYESRVTGEETKNMFSSVEHTDKKGEEFGYESINKFKNQYRHGYREQAPQKTTIYEKLILNDGGKDTNKLKRGKMFGNQNGADGHNGHMKNELYYANYLNQDGVGNRK